VEDLLVADGGKICTPSGCPTVIEGVFMTSANPTESNSSDTVARGDASSFAQRRPVEAFLVLALGIGWIVLAIPAIAGIPMAPFLLGLVFVALLGSALLVTRLVDGPGAIRRLLARNLIWRFGIVRWLVIVFGMPVLTLVIAAVSGTLRSPEDGWANLTTSYLVGTFIIGALIINLWEETAWAGFVQTRLMATHGLLRASVLTAIPFAAIHIPLQFEGDWTWSRALVGVAIVFALAPFYRYLLGMHMLDSGGSLLAAGIQHASWNEATKLDAVSGDWQVPAAVILLTVIVAVGRRLWRPESRPLERVDEEAAAAKWTARSYSKTESGS
jgi:CAAX protease family protein